MIDKSISFNIPTFIPPHDHSRILALSNTYLGKNYITSKTIQTYLCNPSKKIITAHDSNQLIGFVLISKASPTDQLLNKQSITDYINHTDQLPIGIIQTICLDQAYQNKGIGTQLIKEGLNQLKLLKCKTTICIIWNKTGLEKIFTNLKFQSTPPITNYWYSDSIIYKYTCPICGTPPCRCTAYIAIKHHR